MLPPSQYYSTLFDTIVLSRFIIIFLFIFCFFSEHRYIYKLIYTKQYIHPSSFAEASQHFLHCFFVQTEKPPWGTGDLNPGLL
jgi:hypothetical protein